MLIPKEIGMGRFKEVKYVIDNIEHALVVKDKIKELFQKERLYLSHMIKVTKNNRFLVIFKIRNDFNP